MATHRVDDPSRRMPTPRGGVGARQAVPALRGAGDRGPHRRGGSRLPRRHAGGLTFERTVVVSTESPRQPRTTYPTQEVRCATSKQRSFEVSGLVDVAVRHDVGEPVPGPQLLVERFEPPDPRVRHSADLHACACDFASAPPGIRTQNLRIKSPSQFVRR